MTVFAVIPTFNRRDVLARCLRSLLNGTVRPVICVSDSGSSDGTAEMLRRDFPDVVICPGTSDLWWTGATNLAIREILRRCGPDDYVLCINDDTEVGPHYLENLMSHASRNPRRAVGSVSVDSAATDTIIDGGVRMNWLTALTRTYNLGRRLSEFPPGYEQTVDVLPGRGALYPARAFRELGLFAEQDLPHYAADYEFAARCARAGYELLVCYDAVVRSRTDLTGMHHAQHRRSLREAYRYFFDRRSSGNLRDRFKFSMLTHQNIFQGSLFFALTTLRVAKHFLLPG